MDGLSGRPGNGPGSPTAYGGNFLAGTIFQVTQGGMWLDGYYWWVPTGGDTGAQKFALWCLTAASTGSLVSGSVVTSGTLTAGTWNFVPLAVPLQLAIHGVYNACTGWISVNGFPATNNQFGATQPYAAGITNGPLMAFSDTTGTAASEWGSPQGVFGTGGSDPSVTMPGLGSNSANFWVDVSVSDTAPGGYSGSYRAWPNLATGDNFTSGDSAFNYNVGMEFHLTQDCTLNAIWFFCNSAGVTQFPTECAIWSISSTLKVAENASPTWLAPGGGPAAAASGWMYVPFTTVTLPAGQYKVGVYNQAASPQNGWSMKRTGYWGSSGGNPPDGINGITSGPLYVPPTASANQAWVYNGANPGATPPFSNGTQEPGQSVFSQDPNAGSPGAAAYPDLYVDALFQNYWVDVEVTPVQAPAAPPQFVYMMRRMP